MERPARWNFVSLAAPVVGFFAGVWAAIASSPTHFPEVGVGFAVWAGFCAAGVGAAALALARGERWWGVTAAGAALNVLAGGIVLWASWAEFEFWVSRFFTW